MPRSPLTITIRKAQSIVDQVNALPQEERDLVLDLLLPEPEQETKTKKTRKKRQSKQEKRGLPQQAAEPLPLIQGDATSNDPLCSICANAEDYQDHFQPSPHYHPFAPPVPRAARKSSRKNGSIGASASSPANLVMLPDVAGNAVQEPQKSASAGN